MSPVLVAYAGRNGGTRQIAEVVAAELDAAGLSVDVRDAADVASVDDYAAVVVGSALYYHRWCKEAVRLLERHARALSERPVWLFHSGPCGPGAPIVQVSLPAKVALLAARIDAERTVTFGGRLDPATVHGLIPRLLASGQRAGDFRDWDRIRAWARDVGRRVRTRVPL